MNPEPQILPLTSESAEPPQTNASSPQTPAFPHRGNGKIARLPKTVRDQINNWILDGLSYPDIIERLGEQGQELNPGHLCEYKKRGHQDWLRQREWFEHVTAKSEFSRELLATPDTTALHEAGLRMAAAQMIDQLMRLSANADSEDSRPAPEQFARLVNALSRLTREALSFQKYHDTTAKAQAAEPKHLDPAQKPSQKAQDMLLTGWRNFFGHDLTQPMPDEGRQTSSPPLPSPPISASTLATPDQPFRVEADTASPSVHPSVTTTTDHSSPQSLSSLPSLVSHPLTVAPIPPTDPTTEALGNLQKPNSNSAVPTSPSEILNLKSEIPPPPSQSEFENQNSQPEHCLECLAPLPALRPDHRQPSPRCGDCGCKLPPPPLDQFPALDLDFAPAPPAYIPHHTATNAAPPLNSPELAAPPPPTPGAAERSAFFTLHSQLCT